MPDRLDLGQRMRPVSETVWASGPVSERGVGPLVSAFSGKRSGRIGLFNSSRLFTEPRGMRLNGSNVELPIEARTIQMGRWTKLRPMNAYREAFGMPRTRNFDDLTGDPETTAALAKRYGSVDDVDLYVGLLAKRHDEAATMGSY